jgi:peptidoglycan/xylan/chitin deacetylase (PgdA/CDA1 family)
MRYFRIALAAAFMLFCPSSFISAGFPAPLIIEHGPRNSTKIALTFDACCTGRPDEYDAQVVEILLREKAPATLFLSGRWVEKNAEKAKFLSTQEQFEIANHSYYHPHLTEATDERVTRELTRTQNILKKVTGKKARYFRPPYGEVDERVAKLASEAGLMTIQYDLASGDPDPGLSAGKITATVLREARGGSIIVFHMNRNGVHTAEMLPAIISGLRQKGYTLVTVGELLQRRQRTEKEEDMKRRNGEPEDR